MQLEQRCIEPGHWLIEGRHVRAVYQGRSRNTMYWTVEPAFEDEEVPITPPGTLHEAREWIRDQIST